MAKQRGHGSERRGSAKRPARVNASSRTPQKSRKQASAPDRKVVFDAALAAVEPRTFRLGAVPGATPGKWIDTWKRRMPHVTLDLVPIDAETQRASIDELDAALIRLPLIDDTLHLIPLYDEASVIVASADSHLLVVDELDRSDLAGEVLITPRDDVLGPLDIPGILHPDFAPLDTTEEAIATAASGVGIVIVPMSLARLHQRKDAGHRPLRGGPISTVALAWPRERTTPDVETFVGIVRGRTDNSSR
ncbi:LysR substrate-binding domain-containing protein [Microbacterium murale]|uniref:DNA-binding transcriptional LysR family regulator n=1 Tax=Microbacterium murale TaxID=1081040 RepID=A0ABU0P5Q4_9MICO|nr:LysR substrate-binding domain-containing protein [Microbacterium murale]MDQ0642659.1 DNA-binding transcriptional LysR family regulator [Microbacterium murale]